MDIAVLKAELAQQLMELPDKKFMEVYKILSPLLNAGGMEKPKSRPIGLMKGLIINMGDDFDEPIEDFGDYVP